MRFRRIVVPVVASALVLAACGGGDDESADGDAGPDTSEQTEATVDDAEPGNAGGEEATDADASADGDVTAETADDTADTSDEPGEASGDGDQGGTYEPGDVSFRTVNLLTEPVDVYVRTTGLVEAFPVESGVAPGTITEFAAPPADGSYIVTTVGAGDPTCVSGCDHFITDSSVQFGEGPYRTVVLYDDESRGPSALELWEQGGDPTVSSNAMDEPVPGVALAVVTAVAVGDADFGLFVSTGDGCLDNLENSDIRIGGNQTVPFDFTNVNEYTVHGSQDTDCVDEPVGGPFLFDPLLADRSHVFFFGVPGDMEMLTVPFADAGPGVFSLDAG